MASAAYIFLAALVALVTFISTFNRKPSINFPKGPPTLPFLGNLHQLPLSKVFLTFAEWGRTYGGASNGLIGLRLGPSARAIVINKWQQVRDLIDARGSVYSDRPYFPIVEYVIPPPGNLHLAFMPYGGQWRRTRRAFTEFVKDSKLEELIPIQDAESTQMVWELMTKPEDYRDNVMRCFGAVILASVFGQRGKDFARGGKLRRFFEGQEAWAAILDPGAAPPIELFPFLRYVPDAITPWKGWKDRAANVKNRQSGLYLELWDDAEKRVLEGKSPGCLVKQLLSEQERVEKQNKFSQVQLSYIGGFLMEAGADTNATAILVFILAMASFPEVQRQVQEEVDSVYENMPHTTEMGRLPFLTACMLETLRWRPSLPLALPHATSQDDNYLGYTIPKGTTVIMNVWAIQHDPDEFEDPHDFNPRRYLANPLGKKGNVDSVKDLSHKPVYVFGGGRRICAGQKMAENSLIMAMSKLVWAFDFTPSNGLKPDTDVRTAFQDSMLTAPNAFPVTIKVRNEGKREAIKGEWAKADAFLGQYE